MRVYEGLKASVWFFTCLQKEISKLSCFFFFTGCPVDPRRSKSADVMPTCSHIITPCVTGAFRGGSLSSRSVLQLNGKFCITQPTNFVSVDMPTYYLHYTTIIFLNLPFSTCVNRCVLVFLIQLVPSSIHCLLTAA